MIKITITGARGKMGQTILACAQRAADLEVVGQIDLGDNLQSVIEQTDVLIDFSFKSATPGIAAMAAAHHKPLVIGTTGHEPAEKNEILRHKKSIPIVWASNFSVGVNTLFWLTRKAAEILKAGFDLEIIEMHHRQKRDAPSGTASTLGQILMEGSGRSLALRHGRQGVADERGDNEIGIHSLRGGDVIGDHTVVFAGAGERLELTHRAASRDTFGHGALRAARWVMAQKPGLYDMEHVLGFKKIGEEDEHRDTETQRQTERRS